MRNLEKLNHQHSEINLDHRFRPISEQEQRRVKENQFSIKELNLVPKSPSISQEEGIKIREPIGAHGQIDYGCAIVQEESKSPVYQRS